MTEGEAGRKSPAAGFGSLMGPDPSTALSQVGPTLWETGGAFERILSTEDAVSKRNQVLGLGEQVP